MKASIKVLVSLMAGYTGLAAAGTITNNLNIPITVCQHTDCVTVQPDSPDHSVNLASQADRLTVFLGNRKVDSLGVCHYNIGDTVTGPDQSLTVHATRSGYRMKIKCELTKAGTEKPLKASGKILRRYRGHLSIYYIKGSEVSQRYAPLNDKLFDGRRSPSTSHTSPYDAHHSNAHNARYE